MEVNADVRQVDISIIIAVYNGEDYLSACLDSVCACPSDAMECILVNDGSTDNTGEICDTYALADKRLRVLHGPNSGVSYSRNRGCAEAVGAYVLFLDADDYINAEHWPDILEDVRNAAYDVVAYGYYTLHMNGETEAKPYPIKAPSSDDDADLHRALLATPLLNTCWGKLLRRDLLTTHGLRFPDSMRTCEDAVFMLDVIARAHGVLLRNLCIVYYRQHPQSVMHSLDMQSKLSDLAVLLRRRCDYLSETGHGDWRGRMFRENFSVVTDMLLRYAAGESFLRFRRTYSALRAACETPVVGEILNETPRELLSPIFKKWEFFWIKNRCYAVLAVYFTIKAKFARHG